MSLVTNISDCIDRANQSVEHALIGVTVKRNTIESIYQEQNTYVPDELIIPEACTLKNQSKRVNDKGEVVPEVCPTCGAKISVYLSGEPVYLCSNEKCKKYFGTVPFPQD